MLQVYYVTRESGLKAAVATTHSGLNKDNLLSYLRSKYKNYGKDFQVSDGPFDVETLVVEYGVSDEVATAIG
jgi:hypothetical protein